MTRSSSSEVSISAFAASSAAASWIGWYSPVLQLRSPMREGKTRKSRPPGANSRARKRRKVSASASAWRLKLARVSSPPVANKVSGSAGEYRVSSR